MGDPRVHDLYEHIIDFIDISTFPVILQCKNKNERRAQMGQQNNQVQGPVPTPVPGPLLARRQVMRPSRPRPTPRLRGTCEGDTPLFQRLLQTVMLLELVVLAWITLWMPQPGFWGKLVFLALLPLYGWLSWGSIPSEDFKGWGDVASILRYIALPPLAYFGSCSALLFLCDWFLSLF